LFVDLTKQGIDSKILANTFTNIVKSLEDSRILQEQHYKDLFKSLSSGKFSKEAIPQILESWSKNPAESLDSVLGKLGVSGVSNKDLEKLIEDIVNKNKKIIEEKGDRAVQHLMGLVMKEVRGKADGKTVMEILRKKVR
jgi:glutamyl-tRNA(Gln) amidotransferase subunit E